LGKGEKMKLTYERLLKQEFKDGETIEVEAKALQAYAKKKEKLEEDVKRHKEALEAIAESYERLTAMLTVSMIQNEAKDAHAQFLSECLKNEEKKIVNTADYRVDLIV